MKSVIQILETIEAIAGKDSRYKLDAYNFVLGALDFTVKQLRRPRHISGQELLAGIKDYAQEQFGPMALEVLKHWGINSCQDFGNIVFNLIKAKILTKTEQDSLDDFKGGYDLNGALG